MSRLAFSGGHRIIFEVITTLANSWTKWISLRIKSCASDFQGSKPCNLESAVFFVFTALDRSANRLSFLLAAVITRRQLGTDMLKLTVDFGR